MIVFSALILTGAIFAQHGGPAPAVFNIDFAIRKDKFHPARGTAKITALVQNVGDATYSTRPGQQSVQIFEVPPSGVVPMTPKKACDFGNLMTGVTYRCEYERRWDTRAAEGTAPPSYKAVIVYDPDIRTDGNPKNDDVYLGDNQLQIAGTRINELFRRP